MTKRTKTNNPTKSDLLASLEEGAGGGPVAEAPDAIAAQTEDAEAAKNDNQHLDDGVAKRGVEAADASLETGGTTSGAAEETQTGDAAPAPVDTAHQGSIEVGASAIPAAAEIASAKASAASSEIDNAERTPATGEEQSSATFDGTKPSDDTDTDTGIEDDGVQLNADVPSAPAVLGPVRLASFGALSIAPDNFWGADIPAGARAHQTMVPLIVQPSDNGWRIVGDPAQYILISRKGVADDFAVPIQEISGSPAAILLYIATMSLAVRTLRGMARARASLKAVEIGGSASKDIANLFGINPSGTTRDVKAAKLERDYPAFAALLISPSEAPTSFYNDIGDYADRTESRSATLKKLAAKAAKLRRTDGPMKSMDAKIALGVATPSAKKPPSVRHELKPVVGATAVTLEETNEDIRIVFTFAVDAVPTTDRVAAYRAWLATIPTPGAAQEG